MAILAITNLDTSTYSSTFGPILAGATRVFSGLTTTQVASALAALDALVVAGTLQYATLTDPAGSGSGSDVQNKLGAVTATSITTAAVTNTGTQTSAGSSANPPIVVAFADSPYTTPAGVVFLCTGAAGAIVFNLPLAATLSGRNLRIKKTDLGGSTITVTKAGSDKIDGADTVVLKAQYDYVVLSSNGVAGWNIFASVITP